MHTRPTTGRSRPPSSTRIRPRGVEPPRHAVGVPDRDERERRVRPRPSRRARRRRPPRPRTRLTSATRAESVIAGRSGLCRDRAAERVEPVDGDARPDEVEVQVGPGERGRGVGQVPDRREAAVDGGPPRRGQPRGLDVEHRVRRARRRARGATRPRRPRRALGLRPSRRRRAGPASRRARRRCGSRPVSILRCSRAGRPARRAPSSTAARCARDAADRSIPAATAGAKSSSGRCSHDSTGASIPRRAAPAPRRGCRRRARWRRPRARPGRPGRPRARTRRP